MTKLIESTQWSKNTEHHVFRCWCGEDSFLTVTADKEDGELYIDISLHPTRLKQRLGLAWKALRGLEFSASNSVIVVPEDIDKLVEALNSYKNSPRKSKVSAVKKG